MNFAQPQPQATPAPLHDIVGPVWFLPYPVWMLVLAGLGLLALLALVIWLVRRARSARILTARERALKDLAALRNDLQGADSYTFGIKASDVLRTYIRDQHGVDAITRTSIEFLESLRGNHVFNDNEKAGISEFLTTVDLLKYARQSAGRDELASLLEIAERLVKSEPAKLQPVS